MKEHNDIDLAWGCQEDINLILGGHDHLSKIQKVGKVYIVKSGCDFEEFSDIEVDLSTNVVERT